MRFRRETGDFSITLTLNEETYKPNDVKLPKGLSAEDLLGVFIRMPNGPVNTLISPISQVQDAGYMVAIGPIGLAGFRFTMFYDRTTGILSVNEPTPTEPEPEEEDHDPIRFRSYGVDSKGNPKYKALEKYGLGSFKKGDPVVVEPLGGGALCYGSITDIVITTAPQTVEWDDGQTVVVPAGNPQVVITYDVNGETRTENYIYYNKNTGEIGHVSLFTFETPSSGQTK